MALTIRSDLETGRHTGGPYSVSVDGPAKGGDNPTKIDIDSSNDEELTEEALIKSYSEMYQMWLQVVQVNEKLNG